jgi:hypothetical protein
MERREESLIARALSEGENGRPEAGLAVLEAMNPAPRYRDEVDRARARLGEILAEMDAAPPTVEIATAVELAFKKNETLTVPLRVDDDYRVEKVVVHARNENDDDYLEISLSAGDDGLYHFSVPPELHGNRNVYFFVVARDRSGHVGSLGAREEPQKIERKRWFKKLG